jgi:sporulation protein YlmC with PRC-barrel domain
MQRRLMTAAGVAALLALAPVAGHDALAQTASPTQTQPSGAQAPRTQTQPTQTQPQMQGQASRNAGAAAQTIKPDQMRASKVIGSAVYDRQNQKIGSVKDLILDKDGRVDDIVVDVGSFLGAGGKYVAVKPTEIRTDNNRLTLDRTKDQLKQMAEFRLEDRSTGAGSSASPTTGGRVGTGSGSSKPPSQ